jgi:hypothetical protein
LVVHRLDFRIGQQASLEIAEFRRLHVSKTSQLERFVENTTLTLIQANV